MSTLIQVTVKVSPRVVARAEGLRPLISEEMGQAASRADVLRRALSIGLRHLRRVQNDEGVKPDVTDDEDDDEDGDG